MDPRLNHELLRAQVRQRLGRMALSAGRIYVLNEVGGNVGSSFGNTVDVLVKQGEPILLCGVLDHDDCMAAAQGLRAAMATRTQQVVSKLSEARIRCPVLSGTVRLPHNHLLWADEPESRYQPWSFGTY